MHHSVQPAVMCSLAICAMYALALLQVAMQRRREYLQLYRVVHSKESCFARRGWCLPRKSKRTGVDLVQCDSACSPCGPHWVVASLKTGIALFWHWSSIWLALCFVSLGASVLHLLDCPAPWPCRSWSQCVFQHYGFCMIMRWATLMRIRLCEMRVLLGKRRHVQQQGHQEPVQVLLAGALIGCHHAAGSPDIIPCVASALDHSTLVPVFYLGLGLDYGDRCPCVAMEGLCRFSCLHACPSLSLTALNPSSLVCRCLRHGTGAAHAGDPADVGTGDAVPHLCRASPFQASSGEAHTARCIPCDLQTDSRHLTGS